MVTHQFWLYTLHNSRIRAVKNRGKKFKVSHLFISAELSIDVNYVNDSPQKLQKTQYPFDILSRKIH